MKKAGSKERKEVKLSREARELEALYQEGGITEFAVVCRAKDGDKAAIEWVWRKYRSLLVGMIGRYWWYHRLNEAEMESEAVLALIHKLEVFKPEKIKKAPEEWRFKYMLINAAYHRRNRLKNKARDGQLHGCMDNEEIGLVSVSEKIGGNDGDRHESFNVYDMMCADSHRNYQYNPEETVLSEMKEPIELKEKRLMEMLTPFQKTLLELKRVGLTIQQIADQMGCGFTKVRLQIVQARELAYQVLEV